MPTAPVLAPAGFVPRSALSFGGDGAVAVPVDDASPLPVTSGAPATASTIIAAGTALSPVIDLAAQRLHRITMPEAWTAAALSFQVSPDGQAFADLWDRNGEVVLSAAMAAPGRTLVVDLAAFLGIRYLKLRSGLAAAPVPQADARVLALVTVAR